MNIKKSIYKKWLIGAVFCVIIAIFLLIGSFSFFKNARSVNTNISFDGKPYLSFSAGYAAVDVPLTVYLNGADSSDAVYEWTVGKNRINNSTDSYTPKQDDLEKFISVTVTYNSSESVTASLYCSKLPVIYLNTDNQISDEYVAGTMDMQGNSSYTAENTDFYFGDVYLKLRGNSTKYREKSPYKIKLGKSCNLFNMGESKHWVLLANDIDHTLIRNKLVYDFSGAIGAKYYTESLNVVLILNNEYQGVYQLCEQVRVDENRVDIFDWEELAKNAADTITRVKTEAGSLNKSSAKEFKAALEAALSTDLSWASPPYKFEFQNESYTVSDYVEIPETTGGFLLEMDFYNLNNPNGLKTNFEQPFYFNTPEYGYTNDDLKHYASSYIQSFEYALHSQDHTFHSDTVQEAGFGWYYDPSEGWIGDTTQVFYRDKANDGKHYSELFDMDSLIVNFFVCEFSMNWDSMKNSVFISKDINGPAYMSPVWDFDWAFGNDNMYRIDTYYPTGWHTANNYFTNEQYYQSVQWNRYLVRDPYFLKLAYDKYKEIRPTVIEDIIKDGGLIDTYYDELCEAGTANDSRWHHTYMQYGGKSFDESMAALKEFIQTRITWMDKQFESFDTFVKSIGYYQTSNDISISNIIYNADNTVTIEAAAKNISCRDLVFQINGLNIYTSYLGTDGLTRITVNADILLDTGSNIVEIYGKDNKGKYIENFCTYRIF